MTTLETTTARPGESGVTAQEMMNALVYLGPGNKVWGRAPKPHIQEPTDALIRISTSTICGTDLHILKGDVPTVEEGRVLGHEGIGIVEETGNAVIRDTSFQTRRDPRGVRHVLECRALGGAQGDSSRQ